MRRRLLNTNNNQQKFHHTFKEYAKVVRFKDSPTLAQHLEKIHIYLYEQY